MTHPDRRAAVSLVELLAVLAALAALAAVAVTAVAGVRGSAGVQQSMANLGTISLGHVLYAADWNGRQVSHTPDDLGVYDSIDDYNQANNCGSGFDPGCYPPIIAGFGPTESGTWTIWAYWSTASNSAMMEPISFPGSPNGAASIEGYGFFRFPGARPLHDYINGRYHDPVYFAPNDTVVVENNEICFDTAPEFDPDCNPGWPSYCLSPAALFHPDVMRSNAAGGWQAPWGLDHGYETPGLFQATYPSLKTHMLEHSWVQDPPAPCNPAFFGCEPYYFNHGIDSAPATLFYDGHVRPLPNEEVLLADFQVLNQTGNVDGLWHRGTPFGPNGYFIDAGFDFAPLSHHVLTTDGILGRDTLGPAQPLAAGPVWSPPKGTRLAAGGRALTPPVPWTGEDPP